jgi:beta-lactamase class A
MERALGLWHHPRQYVLGERAGKQTAKIIRMVLAVAMLTVTAMAFFHYVESQIVPMEAANSVVVTPNQPETPVLAAATELPSQTDQALEQLIATWVSQHPGQQWSVAVEDLSSKHNASYEDDLQYDPASMYKLFAVYAFAQRVPVNTWATAKTLQGEGNHTYQECINAMLRYSDNECGEALAGQIGWNYIDKADRQAGFSHTILNRKQGMLGTAADTAALLKRLEQGTLVDELVRNLMLTSLKGQKYRAGIPAGCNGCEVYNKTGDLNGFRHDAAIIYSNGHSYVLAIFSRGGSYAQIADLTKLINTYITS